MERALHTDTKYKPFQRHIAVLLVVLFSLSFFLSACGEDKTTAIPADYGDYGKNIALELASLYPYRSAYSPEEKAAGEYVKSEFEKLGYEVEEQVFSSPTDPSATSINYIVHINGEGLMIFGDDGEYHETHSQVIVGAHYDTYYGVSSAAEAPDFDGIQDNASGVGCLLTIAAQLKDLSLGYDVVLIAFGAGDAGYAGATYYASQLTAEEIANTDAMYCIDSIYAGDKLYASSGWNSLVAGQKYDKRRKLYEAYDVAYGNCLASINGVDLYYNESGIQTDINGDGVIDIYREITTTQSDYTPFDLAGIPTVYFESYDYNYTTLAEMKETKNLDLQAFSGMIRHTDLDSTKLLALSVDEDQLIDRINNTACIIVGAIMKGAHNGVSISDYEAGETVSATVHIYSVETETQSS